MCVYMLDGNLIPGRIDPDPESSIGKKIPPWISILIDKYVASSSASSARSAVTIGKLSVFLTGCVRGEVACSQPESDALIVVCLHRSLSNHCLKKQKNVLYVSYYVLASCFKPVMTNK